MADLISNNEPIKDDTDLCDFCRNFKFDTAAITIDKYYSDEGTLDTVIANISRSGGNSTFRKEDQFQFCPKCGKPRHVIDAVRGGADG